MGSRTITTITNIGAVEVDDTDENEEMIKKAAVAETEDVDRDNEEERKLF